MNPQVFFGRVRRNATPHAILSALLILCLLYLVVVPLAVMVRETFVVHPMERFQIPGTMPGDFTLSHWKKMFTGSSAVSFLYKPLLNTLIMSACMSILAILIGGLLAWLVVRTDIPCKKFISNLAIVPYIMPSWTMSLAWITLFKNPRIGGSVGLFQYLTGVTLPDWFSYGMLPIVITMAVHYFPFGFMLISSALQNVDSQLEESAELLGASRPYVLRKVVFPLVMPAVLSTVLLTFSRGLGTFGTPSFLGGPVRLYVLSTMLHANLVGQRPGIAYVVALLMILMGGLVLYMDSKLLGARKSYVTISGKSGKSGLVSLGRAMWPVTVLVMVFLVCVTFIPFGLLAVDSLTLIPGDYSLSKMTLHYWIGPPDISIGLRAGEAGILRNPEILRALGNSLRLGVLTALVCGVLGMLIGYTVVRMRGTKFAGILDQLSFMPYLMPSIAFGSALLALFAVGRGPIPSLYGTLTLLVIACSVKYLPYSSRAGVSAMMQIGPELEEAATMAGASWLKRMTRVIVPLQKSSFFSGLLLPFISAMRELSLVVLLVSPGTQLATSVTLKFTDKGWYPYTNAVMVLIVIAVLFTTWISRKLLGTDLAKGIGG